MSETEHAALKTLGLDRSGPADKATLPGQPLRPFTVPNMVTYLRLLLTPVFLVLAFNSNDGHSLAAILVFSFAAGSDYLDGLLARLLKQYSRLGVLLDPLIDRLLVVAAMAVAWHFELLPRWLIVVVLARELAMLVVSRYGLKRGLDIKVNSFGRFGLWFTLFAVWLAMIDESIFADLFFALGAGLSLIAMVLYIRSGLRTVGQ